MSLEDAVAWIGRPKGLAFVSHDHPLRPAERSETWDLVLRSRNKVCG